jgi:hypothetical protein
MRVISDVILPWNKGLFSSHGRRRSNFLRFLIEFQLGLFLAIACHLGP